MSFNNSITNRIVVQWFLSHAVKFGYIIYGVAYFGL